MEKLKPQKQRSVISSLKFQRKTDYQKFLKFIKLETKRLKGIEKPKESKVKDILNVGTIGLSAFGIFSLIGKGRDAINKIKGVQDDFQTPFAIGRVRDDDIKFKKQTEIGEEGFKKRVAARKIVTYSRVLSPDGKKILPKKKFVIRSDEQIREVPKQTQTTSEVGGDPTKRTTTITKDDIRGSKGTKQRRLSQNFGKGGSGKVNINKIFGQARKINKKLSKEGFDPNVAISDKTLEILKRSGKVFINTDGIPLYLDSNNVFQRLENLSFKDKTFYVSFEKSVQKAFESLEKTPDLRTAEEILKNKRKTTVKPNIFKRFMNFYNKGRNVRFPDENKAKLIDLIKDDFSQVTYSDSAFKSGKKGFFNLRPFKAFSLDMMKTGPTPLTRQIIERPFKSLLRAGSGVSKMLFKNPLVNALLKSKVTKTGLFLIDAIFAGQEFYDLFMRPGDNVYTSLHDLYVSINNAYFHNNPEKLKYYITESKGSGKFFGVGPGLTNEQIRRKEIERNLKIKRLKEAAAVEGGGGNNVIVVPQNQQNNNMSGGNNTPITTGGTEVSFLPLEPLNIGDDILLHKLNQ